MVQLGDVHFLLKPIVDAAAQSQAALPGGGTVPPRLIPEVTLEFEYMPWLAVLCAWICFGSFAVPMKSKEVIDTGVHPIIFQCYKTFWCFASAFLVLFFEPFEFTWWGLLSGFSWVPAGIAAVIAVQNIGIACGQAIWQVTIIGTSFLWSFLFLRDENVHNWQGTLASLLGLIIGVVGMTYAFNMNPADLDLEDEASSDLAARATAVSDFSSNRTLQQSKSAPGSLVQSARMLRLHRKASLGQRHPFALPGLIRHSKSENPVGGLASLERDRSNTAHTFSSSSSEEDFSDKTQASYSIGVAAAVFNGIWGGANLVPSHFSKFQGVHYVLSFGIGAMIANVLVLSGFCLYMRSIKEPLPGCHFRVMMAPGFMSGMLWSMGNFCALYAVNTLGQGIGYSLVQASIIVSGLWGILYYREMTGKPIVYWAFACVVCGVGVAGLALEKAPMTPSPLLAL